MGGIVLYVREKYYFQLLFDGFACVTYVVTIRQESRLRIGCEPQFEKRWVS